MSHSPRHRHDVPRHRVARAVAVSLATVLVVALAAGFFAYRHLEGNITAMDVEDAYLATAQHLSVTADEGTTASEDLTLAVGGTVENVSLRVLSRGTLVGRIVSLADGTPVYENSHIGGLAEVMATVYAVNPQALRWSPRCCSVSPDVTVNLGTSRWISGTASQMLPRRKYSPCSTSSRTVGRSTRTSAVASSSEMCAYSSSRASSRSSGVGSSRSRVRSAAIRRCLSRMLRRRASVGWAVSVG